MTTQKGFTSANQAYKNFIEESGQAALPKAQQTPFADWLNKVKGTGELSSLLTNVKDKLNQKSDDKFGAATANATVGKKPFRPLGMHPALFTGVSIVAVTLLVYGSIQAYKHFSKKT